jgi:TP901 family phage tail tape measure protein
LNASGQWSASIKTIKSTSESFTNSLEKNKLSMGEYFRFAGGSTKTFGKLFTSEFNTIEKVARERVKDLQTQYISLGRDAGGALKSIAVRPLALDMNDLGTRTAMAAQKQQILNQLLKQGSTNLLNFGKNTQWAGRQLMVGFTIPLSIFGGIAAKTFQDLEKQVIRFKRVYGDAFSTDQETDAAIDNMKSLAKEFTKYGVTAVKTLELAADAAQMGLTGSALQAQVIQATRLAVLGEVEQQEALKTSISLTNSFGIAAEDLAAKIDFLNAVENETVTAISDLTIAIPKAAPVIKQLGGGVEELAFFLTAMKEGGINASEGANALKSGLAALINPTGVANTMLKTFGINIKEIRDSNLGDVKGLVVDFAEALDELAPSQRAQVIEQLFGKFQFARISTLLQNVTKDGSQAARVLELTAASTKELADISSKELRRVEESTTFRFQKAIEQFQMAIAPIGEEFLKLITPVIEFATKIIEKFNDLSDGAKGFITGLTILLGAVGPVALMTFGLLANGIANIIKGFVFVRDVFLKTGNQSKILGEQIDYMTTEQLQASAVAASLDQIHQQLIQTFSVEAGAVKNLGDIYRRTFAEQQRFDTGRRIAQQTGMKLASGIVSVPGPKGAGDIVPAMLSPGEAVIPAKAAQKYAPLIQGMISDNIPGFNKGVMLGMPRSGKSTGKNREAAEEIYQMFLNSSYANVPPTNYGHQLSPTTGHSFPIFGLGGVYMGPGGEKVFVKPVMDEKAAHAEMRGTQIARQVHGLKSPEQRIVVIADPQDPKRQRRFLALESKLDSTFVNNDPMAVFNEEQYFKQLVASLLRVDKDLAAGNLFGDVVADVGPAGVFNRASGIRNYDSNLPSMEDQAMINLLGIKGGAKRAFAESTLGLMAGLTPEQYHQRMIQEIQQVLPLLKQTVAGFGLTDPTEVDVYNNMIRRLEQGLTTDWSKFHAIHSAVKPAKPRQTGNAIPGYADGVVSVPGPKGKGDVVPAMLSPGEAVIPTKMAKKYAPLINAMISGNIPGYNVGKKAPAMTRQSALAPYAQLDVAIPGILDKAAEAFDSIAESGKKITATGVSRELNSMIPQLDRLVAIAKTTVAFRGPDSLSGSASSNTGVNLTHLGPAIDLTVEQAHKLGAELVNLGLGSSTVAKMFLEATGTIKGFSQLVALAPRALNEGRLTGNEAASYLESRHDFLDIEGKKKSMSGGESFLAALSENYNIDPNDPEAQKFINLLIQGYRNAGEEAVGDPQLYVMVEEAISQLFEGATKSALQQAGSEFRTFSAGGSKRESLTRGVSISATGAAAPGTTSFIPESVNVSSRKSPGVPYKQLSDNSSFVQNFRDPSNQIADAFSSNLARDLLQSASSSNFEIAGKKITGSVASGVQEAMPKVDKAGKEVGETAAQAVRIGARRVTTDPNAIPMASDDGIGGTQAQQSSRRGSRRATSGGVAAFDEATGAYSVSAKRATQANEDMSVAASKAANTSQSASDKLSRMNSVVMNGTFALTSLAGVGMMAGGAIAEASSLIFQFSGVIFALMQITQLLTQAKIAELVATRIKIAKEAAFGTGLGVQTAAQAATGLGATFSKLGVFVSKLFSPIGWVVLGLTAIAGVIAFVIKAQNDQKKKTEELGNATFLTAEKIKKAGDLLGFEAKTSAFGQNIVAGSAAGRSQEETGAIATLRENDSFKKDFASEISGIRNATKEAAEIALASVSNQLFAAGAGQEQVDAYVRAIAQEAERTDLSFDFAQIDFTADGAASIVENAKKAAEIYKKKFEETKISPQLDKDGDLIVRSSFFGGQEGQAAIKAYAASVASTMQSLKDGLANGLISAEDFGVALSGVGAELAGLDEKELAIALPELYKDLGIEKVMSEIPNVRDQLLLLQADAAGVQIQDFEMKALENSNKSARANAVALRVRRSITKAIREEAAAREVAAAAAEKQAIIDEEISAANVALSERISQLEDQKVAYDTLIAAGYEAAIAFELAGDSGLAAGIRAATGFGVAKEELEGILNLINLQLEAEKNAPKGPSSAGAAEKTPLQQATEQLQEQRKEILNASAAYGKLRKAGLSVADAMTSAEDPILAAALATTQVGTSAWTKLVNKIKEVTGLLKKKEIQELLKTGKVNIENKQKQVTVSSALSNLGYSVDQIDEVLSNQELTNTLAKDLEDGKISSKQLLNVLSQIKQLDNLDVALNFTTKEGAEREFQKRYDKVVGFLEAQKQTIEVNFQVKTFDDRIIARKAEEEIAGLNFIIDDYEAGLTKLEKEEKKINDTYDERKKALDKISKANEAIARQQKGQLTIADALSQGDIAAAARAVQEMRAEQAKEAATSREDALELSRERSLKRLSVDVNGINLTREQIEKRVLDLKEKIFDIEEKRLEPANEAIRLAGVEKDAKLDSLNAQILRWDVLSARVNEAKLRLTPEEMAAMEYQASLIADLLENWNNIEDKTATLTIIKKTIDGAGPTPTPTPTATPTPKPAPTTSSQPTGPAPATQVRQLIPTGGNLMGNITIAPITAAEKPTAAQAAAALNAKIPATVGKQIAKATAAETKKIVATTTVKKPAGGGGTPLMRLAAGGFAKMSYLRMGGMLPYKSEGGSIFKPLGTDTIPAMLTPGEFVVRKHAVANFGVDRLSAINSGTYKEDSVYNYSVSVNVKSDSNPDQIARAVMTQIKQVDSMRLRGNKF